MTEKTPAQLWVEALRSGEYQQCKGSLEKAGMYCCLGVACKVAQAHGIPVETDEHGEVIGLSLDDQPAVQQWLGLEDGGGDCGADVDEQGLITLNDRQGYSFWQIADVIESRPPGLFVEE